MQTINIIIKLIKKIPEIERIIYNFFFVLCLFLCFSIVQTSRLNVEIDPERVARRIIKKPTSFFFSHMRV